MKRITWIKRGAVLLLAVMILTGISPAVTVLASDNGGSYLYDIWGEAVPAPAAYELERSLRASDLGVESLAGMTDIFYRNGRVYITMSEKIVITDSGFQGREIISEYKRGTETFKIKAPTGIYVTEDDHIYIAEQEAGEIVEFDDNHQFVRALLKPEIRGMSITYAPSKLVVDSVGRIYVKAKSVYEGLIELDPEGNFNRFVGANEVKPSVIERFYRMIATEEQVKRMQMWLPTDYSDIAIDRDGFIFATVNDVASSEPVRKLNSRGKDVMPEPGKHPPRPMGDTKGSKSVSLLAGVTCSEDGRFAVLDTNNSKIFVYGEDAGLMYILGGSGKTEGSLNSPVDLAFMEDKILVTDLVTQSVEVYRETAYGALINSALKDQANYDYDSAYPKWMEVLKTNPYFYYANLGLAKYQLRHGMYREAMVNFEKAGVDNYYSVAFSYVRDNWMSRNFNRMIGVLAVLILLLAGIKIYRFFRPKRQHDGRFFNTVRNIKYETVTWPVRVLTSPFKAFDGVKMSGEGSVAMSVIIFIIYAWVRLLQLRYTGFLVYFADKSRINVLMTMGSTVLPYLVFVIASWAIGVLMNGKGRMVHVFKVMAYSLYLPAILSLAGVLLSNVVTLDEVALVQGLFLFGQISFAFYAFIGLVTVHQYTFTKNVGTIILSFVAMLIIVFVALLLVTLLSGFITDIVTIFTEVRMLM